MSRFWRSRFLAHVQIYRLLWHTFFRIIRLGHITRKILFIRSSSRSSIIFFIIISQLWFKLVIIKFAIELSHLQLQLAILINQRLLISSDKSLSPFFPALDPSLSVLRIRFVLLPYRHTQWRKVFGSNFGWVYFLASFRWHEWFLLFLREGTKQMLISIFPNFCLQHFCWFCKVLWWIID